MSNQNFDEDAFIEAMNAMGVHVIDMSELDFDDDFTGFDEGDNGDDDDNYDRESEGDDNSDRPRLRVEVTLPFGTSLDDAEAVVRSVVRAAPLNAATVLTSSIVHLGAGELNDSDVGYYITFTNGDHHVEGTLDDIMDMPNHGERALYVNGKVWPVRRFDVIRLGLSR